MAKGIFSKLNTMLYKQDEAAVEETTAEAQQPSASQSSPQTYKSMASKNKVDPQAYQTIIDAISNSGKSFAEFTEMLSSFQTIISDEATRYKSAFVALQKSKSATVTQLLSAIEQRKQALQTENENFAKTLEDEQQSMTDMQKEIGARDNTIASLLNQIEALKGEKQKIQTDIDKQKNNIDVISSGFNNALVAIQTELDTYSQKIKTFLKEGK